MIDYSDFNGAFFDVPVGNNFPWTKFVTSLSGTSFSLVFRFNTRMSVWFMDIQDQAGNSLLSGVPILIETALIGRFVTQGLPVGDFIAFDDTNQGTEPGRYSFGTDHSLVYADPTQTPAT